jgi:hypothetical protein
MKLKDLKIGHEVTTYCCGDLVIGEVIDVAKNSVVISHRPIVWADQVFTETSISKSSSNQMLFHSETTPAAWFEGKEITCK